MFECYHHGLVLRLPCANHLLFDSLAQYCFAMPKPLKARPGPRCCRIAPLCKQLFCSGAGWILVDLFTVVAAPTTCSLTNCLLFVWVSTLDEKSRGGGIHFGRKRGAYGYPLWTWITATNHRHLWINLKARIA